MKSGAPQHLLILGGSREARALADRLAADRAPEVLRITYSLAGRTRDPLPLPAGVRLRTGGFGGAAGLAAYIAVEGVTHLVDATHPFAAQMAANAAAAARRAGVPALKLLRPPWPPGRHWLELPSLADAVAALPARAAVFLALGRDGASAFAGRPDLTLTVRVAEPPQRPLFPFPHRLIVGSPAADEDAERDMLAASGALILVIRNAGGTDGWAKLEAAASLRLPVLCIARPRPPQGIARVDNVEAALALLDR